MSLSVKEYASASLLLVGFPQAVLAQQQRPGGAQQIHVGDYVRVTSVGGE